MSRALRGFGMSLGPIGPIVVRPAPTPAPEPAPSPMTKVSQAQIDPAMAAQTMTVNQIRTLPSPLKEQTVATAITQGRTDVTAAVAKEVSPEALKALDTAMRAQADTAQNAAAIQSLQKQVASVGGRGDLSEIMAAIGELKAQVARHEAAIGTMISDFSTSYQDLKTQLKKKGRA